MTRRVKYTAICNEWKLINNLQIESDTFCASGLIVMGFLLWGEGSGKQDLRVVGGWGFLFQVFERLFFGGKPTGDFRVIILMIETMYKRQV